MQFNNKGFESGVASTLTSLKKLDDSLKMKDASKGLTDVSSSLNKLSTGALTGLGKGVDAVASKFTTMGVIATTALMNITNKAVDAGTALVKSLTTDPIMQGFSEYETKMGSIQTILTNTAHAGTTLQDVTGVLDELNKYADQTIYNFAEMTRNIGTFTAAGIDLDTSAAAIKGIANLAAASGSTSAQASTAMYQLSQALAAGKVSLMDWNSVVNAGMGGKLFQDSLIRTSEVMGTHAEDMIKKYGSFRESLTKGEWLTSEVLTETLKQLSGAYTEADLIAQGYTKSQAQQIVELAKNASAAATEVKTVTQLVDTMKESVQSGWAQSWEYIIGDKDQATKTLTAISEAFNNLIGPSTDARNEMLKFWNEAGGRDDVLKGLGNIFQSIGKAMKAVGDAWKEVFPALDGKDLTRISAKFADFTKKLKLNDATALKIKDTFKGVFSVFKIVADAVGSVFSVMGSGVGVVGTIGDALLTCTSSVGRYLTSLQEGIDKSKIFEKATSGIQKGMRTVGDIFSSVGDGIKSFFKSFEKLSIVPVFETTLSVIEKLAGGLSKVFEGMGNSIGKLDLNKLLVALTALAGKNIFKTIKDSISGVTDVFDSFKGIGDSVTTILDGVGDSLKAYQENLNAGTLIKIAAAIGILAAALVVLCSIKPGEMENGLIAMTTLIVELVAGMALLTKAIGVMKFGQLNGLATALIGLATALLLMATALKKLSDLSMEQIATGLIGVAGAMLVLVGGVKLMDGASKGLTRTATSMVVLAAALIVMAEAVERFGQLNPEVMLKGLVGVGVALTELGLFVKLTSTNQMSVLSATGLLILASALLVFQNAVAKFGEMDTDTIIKGLATVGAMLLELAIFVNLATGSSGMLTVSTGMLVLAAAVNVMVPAFKSLANLEWDQINRGLTTLAGTLTILGVATKLISGGQLAAVGAGLGIMSAALIVLSGALAIMGGFSWEEIAKGLVTLAGSLTIFAVAMNAMSTGLVGAAAMTVMAAAMAIFTPQLLLMAKLSWGEIAAGLAMLAGAFTVIGVAGAVLTPLAPAILALSGAIALLGAACLAVGAGVSLFATGMAALAAVGAAGGYALAEILRQLIALLPKFAKACGDALIEFAKAIGEGIPKLLDGFKESLVALVKAIGETVNEIVELGLKMLTDFCNAVTSGAPQLIDAGVKMVIALAEGLIKNAMKLVQVAVDLVVQIANALADNVGKLTQAAIELGIAIINGLADGIENNREDIKNAIKNLGKAIIDTFKDMLGIHSPSKVFDGFGINIVEGLIQGVGKKVGEAVNKIRTLASDMINAIKTRVGEFLTAGGELISKLAQGISSKVSSVLTAIKTLVTNAVTNVKTRVGEFLSAGGQLITNLTNGITSKASTVANAFKNAVNSAKTTISGMVSSFKSVGTNLVNGLKSGITAAASSIASAAKSVVQKAINAAKNALKIKSPSRVFMEIGDYTVQGFVKGLNDNADTVDEPAVNLAQRAINGVSDTIAAMSSALQGEIDTNIVISPVMDLTSVREGNKTIRELMNESGNLAVNADLSGSISRSMGSVQNGSNERLLAAIKDLRDNMGNNTNTTYHINGITYDDGSAVQSAIETLIRATTIERRI